MVPRTFPYRRSLFRALWQSRSYGLTVVTNPNSGASAIAAAHRPARCEAGKADMLHGNGEAADMAIDGAHFSCSTPPTSPGPGVHTHEPSLASNGVARNTHVCAATQTDCLAMTSECMNPSTQKHCRHPTTMPKLLTSTPTSASPPVRTSLRHFPSPGVSWMSAEQPSHLKEMNA